MCNSTNAPGLIEKTKQTITAGIPDAKVEILDLGGRSNHLEIKIISDVFVGLRLIKQHQMIMDLLKDSLKDELHAVILKTLTFDQAKG
jgi:stress-induced morphogen